MLPRASGLIRRTASEKTMHSIWPWLAVAGAGALHGLNPASGWLFAAARGARRQNRTQMLRALASIAVGHAASIALVAGSVALGLGMDRSVLQIGAGVLLGAVIAIHFLGHKGGGAQARMPTGHAGLALWSFIMATAHGSGMMLVPALVPLCIADSPAREITASGSLALALAAVALHTAAMLAVTGVIAKVARRGLDAAAGRLPLLGRKLHPATH
jgi:hypothetical protein